MQKPLILLVSAVLLFPALAVSQSGAVFTTNKLGSTVNGNTYKRTTDVYLNAGPCSGGLPDGNYYFQVTDTSGQNLLSTDDLSKRIVGIANGVITSASDHSLGKSPCGNPARSVQLSPFDISSNAEHKVWLTPVSSYSAGTGFHGFLASASKTDNFKVEAGRPIEQSIITGFKFYDADESSTFNPTQSANDVKIAGWRIEIYKNNVLDGVTFTDDEGEYTFIRPKDDTVYEIREKAPGGFIGDNIVGAEWLATTSRSGTVTANAASVAGPNFGNLRFVLAVGVGRSKGFWHNNNGKDLLADCEPRWRNDLNEFKLRHPIVSSDPAVSIFSVSTTATFDDAFSAYAAWSVGNPTSGHTAYQLSREVAATVLNNSCGFIQGTIMINRNSLGILVPLADMLAQVKVLLADSLAGLTGPQATDPDVIALANAMKACINEFGDVNSADSNVINTPSPSPGTFGTPYE